MQVVQQLIRNIRVFQFARQIIKVKNQFIEDEQSEIVEDDDSIMPMDQFKGFKSEVNKEEESKFDQEHLKAVQETILYKGDDPYYDKLVERQQKGVVWGLGGELLRGQQSQFNINDEINAETVINFLELNQIKDIKLVDLADYKSNYIYRYGIVGSMYSSVHGWKVCKDLVKGLTTHWELEVEQRRLEALEQHKYYRQDPSTYALYRRSITQKMLLGKGVRPLVSGQKDDEWMMVSYKNIMVHLVNEDMREELGLEDKWKYQQTPEEEIQMDRLTKSKNLFEPFKQ